ncbi:hypothetical protein TH0227_02860 [Helicobacter pylori]
MGTLMEKWFGFYPVRKELEARISGLENANNQLRQKNDKLFTTKEKLTKANTDLKTENDKLNHQVIALTKEQDSLKYERTQLQDARGFLE